LPHPFPTILKIPSSPLLVEPHPPPFIKSGKVGLVEPHPPPFIKSGKVG